MSILIDEKTPVIFQGFTGDKATFHAKEMIALRHQVVGGVTPGKGGSSTSDLPVFDTVKDAVEGHGSDGERHLRAPAVRGGRDHGGGRCRHASWSCASRTGSRRRT